METILFNILFGISISFLGYMLIFAGLCLKLTRNTIFEKVQHLLILKAFVFIAYGILVYSYNDSILISIINFAVCGILLLFIYNILHSKGIKNPEIALKRIYRFLWLFLLIPRLVAYIINSIIKNKDSVYSESDVLYYTKLAQEQNTIKQLESEIVNNVFEFKKKTAEDVAVHRTYIEAVDIDSNFDEVQEIIVNSEYSRYPVYEESIDNVVGILHVKDFIRYYFANPNDKSNFQVRNIMRNPYFIIMSKPLDEIFPVMQKGKRLMAVVVDEYGGCFGLLTTEDLIEQLVGEIYDEYDDLENNIITLSTNSYRVNGATTIEEIYKKIPIEFDFEELPFDKYYTIGGFTVHLLDKMPLAGDWAMYKGYKFTIEKVEDRRIVSIKIERQAES